jgi:hypothetical protein
MLGNVGRGEKGSGWDRDGNRQMERQGNRNGT